VFRLRRGARSLGIATWGSRFESLVSRLTPSPLARKPRRIEPRQEIVDHQLLRLMARAQDTVDVQVHEIAGERLQAGGDPTFTEQAMQLTGQRRELLRPLDQDLKAGSQVRRRSARQQLFDTLPL